MIETLQQTQHNLEEKHNSNISQGNYEGHAHHFLYKWHQIQLNDPTKEVVQEPEGSMSQNSPKSYFINI